MHTEEAEIILEAVLLCSVRPLDARELVRLFDGEVGVEAIDALLARLQQRWQGRGIELSRSASGWRFQSTMRMASYFGKLNPDKTPRYSRALLETLAIIAYRQPVTRGDIEEIRGVGVASHLVRTLEERGWVEVVGHRDVLGRPELLGTTPRFLDDLGLQSVAGLPSLIGPDDPLPDGAGAAAKDGQASGEAVGKTAACAPHGGAFAVDAGPAGSAQPGRTDEPVEHRAQ